MKKPVKNIAGKKIMCKFVTVASIQYEKENYHF
jgi:hypothetical protein